MKKWQFYLSIVSLLSIVAIEIPIIAEGQFSIPQKSETIIVLGAKLIGKEPSTMLRLRLDKAVELYHQNYGSTIIVSGGQGQDEIASEASVMKNYLITQGIPETQIFLEDQSYNTQQNLANSQKIMNQNHLNTAIIVSNASHIRRALLLANNLNLKASAASAPMADNLYLTLKQYLREGAAMAVLLAQGY